MIKKVCVYAKILILSKKSILTYLLVLFSIGSYTFSEITPAPYSTLKKSNSNFILKKSITNNFYYLTPIYYKNPIAKDFVNIVIPKASYPSEMIMNIGVVSSHALANFLTSTNNNIDKKYAQSLADIYIEEANNEGVNPDIAFAQMCLETGFLRFDGEVGKHQYNFCGLGVTGNGIKGHSFTDIRVGVRAHIQHLKAYASTNKLNKKLVDKRFKFVKRGSATNINGLTGKWASDSKYDIKIRNLLSRLYNLPG